MHQHKEIDVISVMGKGAVNHEGSLKHGKSISNNMAQVQRAGSEGFSHNEINPSANRNQLIQIWVLPDEFGERAGYKTYSFEKGTMTKIYGGAKSQNATFYSKTSIKVGRANKHQEFALEGEVMAYLPRGSAIINGDEIPAKSLVHVDDGLNYEAQEDDALVIFIYVEGR